VRPASAYSRRQQAAIVAAAAHRFGVPARFLWGVFGTETGFGSNVHNSGVGPSGGAKGPFQFEDSTADAYVPGGRRNAQDFKSAAFGAAKLLASGKGGGELGMVAKYYGAPSQTYLSSVRSKGQTFPKGVHGGDAGGMDVSVGSSPASVSLPAPTAGGTGLVDLLQARLQQPQGPPVTPPAAPSFAAHPALPATYQPVSAGPPSPPPSSLSDQLSQLQQIGADAQGTPQPIVSGGGSSVSVTGGGGAGGGGSHSGGVKVASGANRPGVGLTSALLGFADTVASRAGPFTITTGTNHNRLTVNGNVSDHYSGNAADIAVPVDSHRGDVIATAALESLGVPQSRARSMAQKGGLFTIPHKGRRYQVIWKTYEGGNHHNHVHIGVGH
jgi:hypothetical protein